MVNFDDILLAYLVIGAVMLGGGAISWDESGPIKAFANNDDGQIQGNDTTSEGVTDTGGAIGEAINLAAGAITLVWSLIKVVITYLNWPIFVLASNNAPPMMTVLLGVPMTGAFYISLVRVLRTS